MDSILVILFGAVISMTTAVTFMEARKIRKLLESELAERTRPVAAKTSVAV